MSIDIHWTMYAKSGTADQMQAILQRIADHAAELGFTDITPITHFTGPSANYATYPVGETRSLLVGGLQWSKESNGGFEVYAREAIAFSCVPGEGASNATFGFAKHKPQAINGGPSGCSRGWRWKGGCTTQYASETGIENFVTTHKRMVALAEFAKAQGVVTEIRDDTQYAEHHDEDKLIECLRSWNGVMAALAGAMKDSAQGTANCTEFAIQKFKNFERMEAIRRDDRDKKES